MMKYPHLGNLIGAYLNQDYSHYADTLEGAIEAFKNDATVEQVRLVRADISAFLREQHGALDRAFDENFGVDFDPKLWDLTPDVFLGNLDRQLQRR